MPDETQDVNIEAAASAASTTESVTQNTDVKSEVDSSAAAPTQEKAQTLEDIARSVVEKSESQPDGEQEDKATPEEGAKEEDQKKVEGQTESKGPIPYERFAEVNAKKVELEQHFESIKPIVESYNSIHNFLQENRVTPDQFKSWMDIAALFNSDPAKALESLKPYLQVMQGYTGESIDADLQKAVDDGEINLKFAKELMATRTKSQFVERQSAQSQQQQLAHAQNEYFQRLNHSLNSWVSTKAQSVPEFQPKTNATEPDGFYEFFMNKFALDARNAQPKSEQELIGVAEATLKSIQAAMTRFAPKPPNGSKTVRSSQTNTQVPRAPRTVDEAVQVAAKRHGLTYNPR